MKNLKKIVLIMFIIIIFIIITLFIINISKNNFGDKAKGNKGVQIDYENIKIEEVSDSIKFFTVRNCINQYLDTININNASYYRINENGQQEKYVETKEIKERIYNLLDKKYIKEKSITVENVLEKVYKVDKKVSFNPLKMKVLKSPMIETYAVYGYIQDVSNNYIKDSYMIVNLDFKNKTFSIEHTNDKYSTIDEIKLSKREENIEKNSNNAYVDQKINDEYVANQFFMNYKRMIIAKPDLLYEYLDEEYKKNRFNNVDKFIEYVKKNKEDIQKAQFKKYLINNYRNYREFVCQDQYENLYIFKVESPINYKIQLDDYTLDYKNEEYIKKYNSSTDQYKVANNINKWVKMLNNRDYKAAYNVLDKTFREKFGGEEKFENYMRKAFPEHYSIEYGKTAENAGIYTQEITLKDVTGKSNMQIEKTIIMKLEKGTNFTMSFNTTKGDTAR